MVELEANSEVVVWDGYINANQKNGVRVNVRPAANVVRSGVGRFNHVRRRNAGGCGSHAQRRLMLRLVGFMAAGGSGG